MREKKPHSFVIYSLVVHVVTIASLVFSCLTKDGDQVLVTSEEISQKREEENTTILEDR